MKKKSTLCFLAIVFFVKITNAQLDKEVVVLLNYEKYNEVISLLEKKVSQDPTNAQSIFWLGEAYIEKNNEIRPQKEDIEKAKNLYQKYLQNLGSNPWLLVGMSNVEILLGGDVNSAKQQMEQAITASIQTKGKNKGKPSLEILYAIGRIHSEMTIHFGDHNFAIEKIKLALTMTPIEPELYVELGINYLKLGADNGGDAVVAFREAIKLDPKNAKAYYKIAKIYISQDNKEKVDEYANEAIKADPNFSPLYVGLFEFYEDKDINVAKSYLDKYIQYAEKNININYIEAEYLFRTAKYKESIEVVKAIEREQGIEKLSKFALLLALNYERIQDSIQAAVYIEKYFSITPADKINPIAFDAAINIYSRIPEKTNLAIKYIEEQLKNQKSTQAKIKYINNAIKLLDKVSNYKQEYNWYLRLFELKANLSERDYYDISLLSKKAGMKPELLDWTMKYMTNFPNSKIPRILYFEGVISLDPDTTTGSAIPYLEKFNTFLMNQNRENRQYVNKNVFYCVVFYLKKLDEIKDVIKTITLPDQLDSISVVIDSIGKKLIDFTTFLSQAYQDKPDDLPKIELWINDVKLRIDNCKDYCTKNKERLEKLKNYKKPSSNKSDSK